VKHGQREHFDMASGQLATLVRHLRRLTGTLHEDGLSDRQLLECFAGQRDEDAFRALVQRHQGLVMGVCRRVLHQPQDAEDAFQATFLVLARKAQAVCWQESVAGWLSQTAYRLAAELRGKRARQRRCERQALTPPRAVPEPGLRQLSGLLDEELHRMPEKYRLPLLLCYLEGDTREQVATKLGWSLRTLERRLQQGRNLLRARLKRHGVTFSAALLAARLAQDASAAQAAALAVDLGRAAVLFADGSEVLAAEVPRRVVELAQGALRALVLTKRTAGLALGLSVALLVIGAGLQAADRPKGPPQVAQRVQTPQPVRQGDGPLAARKVAPKEVERTDKAIAAGLHWLARQQSPDGHWPLVGAPENRVAGTAFGLLPFFAAGETHKQTGQLHPYAKNLQRGLAYLVKVQQQDGQFSGGMYAQALATWALCQAYELTKDQELKKPAQRAVDYLVQAQHSGGGWRYTPRTPGDTSVSSWVILALKRGEAAGLQIPAETFKRATAYLDSAANPDGSYSYVPRVPGTPPMTAAALLCRLHLGWTPRQPAVGKSVALIERSPPRAIFINTYYYHYATRAMALSGGAAWRKWEPQMRKLLLDRQENAQAALEVRGSWPTTGEGHGQAGGRMMITSLSLLTLLACAGEDRLPPLPARALNEQELAKLWADLGKADVLKARYDMRVLAAGTKQTVSFLKKRLRPAPPVDSQRIAQLIARLDSRQFTAREKAMAELRKFEELARPALQQALEKQPPLELRKRALRLLEEIDKKEPAPEKLRDLRAVEVLRLIDTPAARELLLELCGGAPEAPLTLEAQSAFSRLSRLKPDH
jgi:RNA polymerase sigma factor (sigma-70 family)